MPQWRAVLLLALLGPSLGSPVPPQATLSQKVDPPPEYRLSKNISPESYDILLKPTYVEKRILNIEKFEGTVEIIAEVVAETQVIELHHGNNIETIEKDDIEIYLTTEIDDNNNGGAPGGGAETDGVNEKSEKNGQDGNSEVYENIASGAGNVLNNEIHQEDAPKEETSLEVDDLEYDITTEILKITLQEKLKKDAKISIKIDFTGEFVKNSLDGFYYSSFTSNGGEPTALLATQFESTSARAAFPCFDEPWMKAIFTLSIEVEDDIDVISNTQKVKETEVDEGDEPSEGTTIVKFEPTPKMSTYLLAFIVYETHSFGELGSNGFFATYGRLESENKEEYSDDIGPQMIRELEKFTKVSYYGPVGGELETMDMNKMDQAAIPDFQAGAMENWGLVTYRENALLYDKDAHSSAAKRRIGEVIAHEFAHQWFGDYVTTEWWDSIWLNEGFADFMEYYVMDIEYDNWRMLDRFVLDEQMSAFDADSIANPNALTHPVSSPAEISNHFGTITYSKGGSILRQIRNVLGTEAFQQAIQEYLDDRKFSSATPADLFKWLRENNNERTLLTKENLLEVLENWTVEPGYPVVTVERGSDNTISVTQDRYIFSEAAENIVEKKYYVYLTWYTDKSSTDLDKNPAPQAWLLKDEGEKSISLDENEDGWDWIIVNQNQAGYYRVDYSKDLWNRLTSVLQNAEEREKISALDRAALINNALNLARSSGERNIDYAAAFKLMTFLRSDFEFEPWAAARSSLAHVERLLITSSEYKDFVKYIIESAYKEVKFQDTTDEEKEEDDNVAITNRINILTLACAAGYSDCLEEAESRLKKSVSNDNTKAETVSPDLQPVVYCYGLKGNNPGELWDEVWGLYLSARQDMTRRVIIASALGCVNDKDKLIQYLQYSVDETITVIPYHERYSVFTYVYANPEYGASAALEFLETEGIFEKLSNSYGKNRVRTVIVGLGGRLTTTEQRDKLQEILTANELDTEYVGAITAANSNLKWLDTYEDKVKRGMRDVNGAPTVILASTLAALCAAILAFVR